MWDFNSDILVTYDVLPYFRKFCNDKLSLEEIKDIIEKESQYRFWARCEYEMICHGWPVRKNDYKLDVHEQIMMNINIIAKILKEEQK